MPICFPGAAKKILNYDDFVVAGGGISGSVMFCFLSTD